MTKRAVIDSACLAFGSKAVRLYKHGGQFHVCEIVKARKRSPRTGSRALMKGRVLGSFKTEAARADYLLSLVVAECGEFVVQVAIERGGPLQVCSDLDSIPACRPAQLSAAWQEVLVAATTKPLAKLSRLLVVSSPLGSLPARALADLLKSKALNDGYLLESCEVRLSMEEQPSVKAYKNKGIDPIAGARASHWLRSCMPPTHVTASSMKPLFSNGCAQ